MDFDAIAEKLEKVDREEAQLVRSLHRIDGRTILLLSLVDATLAAEVRNEFLLQVIKERR